jgi:ketosteroid isomerase-like protein
MKTTILICSVLLFFNTSCENNPESSEPQSDTVFEFDKASATAIVEKRSKEFEEALIAGDSIAVGEIYTIDTKIIPYLSGRDEIVGAAGSMIRNNSTLRLTIKELWGDENIIIEDAYVEFYNNNGEITSKGDVLLVWKKEGDAWRIFRDVYKPEEE